MHQRAARHARGARRARAGPSETSHRMDLDCRGSPQFDTQSHLGSTLTRLKQKHPAPQGRDAKPGACSDPAGREPDPNVRPHRRSGDGAGAYPARNVPNPKPDGSRGPKTSFESATSARTKRGRRFKPILRSEPFWPQPDRRRPVYGRERSEAKHTRGMPKVAHQ